MLSKARAYHRGVPRTPLRSTLAGGLVAALLGVFPVPAALAADGFWPRQVEAGAPVTESAPPAAPVSPPPPTPEPRKRTVTSQLNALRDAGLITPRAAEASRERYVAARRTLRGLSGRRRVELAGVLRSVESVVKRGELTSTRVPLAFETLERNRRWWPSGRLLGYGARVRLPGSALVWQSYPGQGIQVQWLGTFGRANGLFGFGDDEGLRAILDEGLRFASTRAGGIAFESWFSFDGGRPTWVSSLSQGTAVQALSRAAVRLKEPRYFEAARASLGIFRTPPPLGVRVATPAGAHYAQYSFRPSLRIVNGFVQALNGLYDFGRFANDEEGRTLFAAGESQLRAELPGADTGAWSLYAVGGRESDVGYHRLLRDFLRSLCARTRPEALYCETAQRFTGYLTTAPQLALVPRPVPARKGRSATVRFTLSKVSSVTLTARRGRAVVFTRTSRLARGRHGVVLPKLRSAKRLGLSLRAVDPAGNVGVASGTLAVSP